MVAIQQDEFLYEILYRGGPNGFFGAHAINLERISRGADILSDKELPGRSITEAEFGALLGGQSAALIEAADTARAERDAAVTAREAAITAGEQETARADALQAQLATAAEQIATLQMQLASATA